MPRNSITLPDLRFRYRDRWPVSFWHVNRRWRKAVTKHWREGHPIGVNCARSTYYFNHNRERLAEAEARINKEAHA